MKSYVLKNPRRTYPEKVEESVASRLMCNALGFTRWNLQQPRATGQTPGWPDVLYTHPKLGLAVWYEAKAPNGKQRDAQKEFQEHVTAAGYEYVVGTRDAITQWAIAKRLIRETAGGGLEVLKR